MEPIFGKSNIKVRPYDFNQFKNGSIFDDFLDVLGLNLTDEYTIDKSFVNEAMPLSAIEVKRLINKNALYHDTKGVNFYRGIIEKAYAPNNDIEKMTMYSAEKEAEISKRYRECNENVARRYLNRKDGTLFTEKDHSKTWEMDDRDILDESVRIMAGADLYLYNEIKELKEEINYLKRGLLYRIYKKLKNK